MRHRRKVRRVSFYQHAIERRLLRSLANVLRLGIADVAGKRDVEAYGKRSLRMLPLAGKAVKNSRQSAGRPMGGEHLERVIPGVFTVVAGAAMNDDRQLGRSR